MITLKAKDTGLSHSFEIGHAERLLRLPNSQWELADDKYEMKDAVIRRKNKKADSRAEKEGDNI